MQISLQNATYLILMLTSVLFPVIFSFEKQIHFVKKWKYLPLSIGIPGAFFIAWDVIFTQQGVWTFSPDYTLGIKLLNLPVEEWLFFIVVPFCSLFIYELVKFYLPSFSFQARIVKTLWMVLALFILIAIVGNQLKYTFWNFTFNSIFLAFLLFNTWFYKHITHFFVAFLVSVVPMLIVNGILTSFPVVSYNPAEFSNLRLFTIPLEDFIYFFLLFSMNALLYEFQQKSEND